MSLDDPSLKWYVVHTYSGQETKALQNLRENIRRARLDDSFGEILIPTEDVLESVDGIPPRPPGRKSYSGYLIVQMDLRQETFDLVKKTAKITGFLGGDRPYPTKLDFLKP